MTDNLKRAGIFRKSIYFFFYGVRSWLLHFEYSEFSLMSSKKPTTRRIKNSQHVFGLQTVLKLVRWQVVAEIGFLRDLGPLEVKAFDQKYSSCIRL